MSSQKSLKKWSAGTWLSSNPSGMFELHYPVLYLPPPQRYKQHYDFRPNAQAVGIGAMYPVFWIYADPKYQRPPKEKLHIAFTAANRRQIRGFHSLALWVNLGLSHGHNIDKFYRKVGGKDNGGPGVRPQYTRTYYAAYVFDPEGRNIELMCMWPGILAEPTSWNVFVALTAVLLGVIVGYFTGLSSYVL